MALGLSPHAHRVRALQEHRAETVTSTAQPADGDERDLTGTRTKASARAVMAVVRAVALWPTRL